MRVFKEDREIVAGGYTYEADGTRTQRMTVGTSDYTYMSKFDKFCEENPDEWKLERTEMSDDDVVYKTYSFPTSCLSFRRGRNKISEEGRQALQANIMANSAR